MTKDRGDHVQSRVPSLVLTVQQKQDAGGRVGGDGKVQGSSPTVVLHGGGQTTLH